VVTNSGGTGTGISLVAGDAVSGITVSGTLGAGISVSNAGNFTIGANVTISGAGADGLDVSGGSGDATVGATISGSAGHSVDVSGRQGGILTLSGAITDNADGVVLASNNNGATISFTGQLTATTTNADPAFQAIGGGTVTVTGPGSTLSTQDAVALDVESTTIGTAGLTFQTISAGVSASSGPAEGVLLSDTGNGPLNVTGASVLGSGGDIQGTSVAAVSASNAGAVSLKDMDMTLQGGDGVEAASVGALAVFSSQIVGGASGIVATGTTNTQPSFDIELNVLNGQQDSAISLTYAGTSSGYVVQNLIGSDPPFPVTIGSVTGDGIDLLPAGGGTLEASVSDNTVDEIDAGIGIDAQAPAGGTLDLSLDNNTVNMDNPGSQDGVQIGSSGTACVVFPDPNDVTAAGTSSSANGMELDLSSGGVFEIQGLPTDTVDPVSYLETVNGLAVGGGGGSAPAVAVTNGPAFVVGPADGCPVPSGSNHLS
jgi:hypothetical protein